MRDIHPAAEIFPMLEERELISLSRDIQAHGLLEPIITLGENGPVLDGRNRLRACEIASVEPAFVSAEPDDPVSFVISKNLKRRHLSESQRAMVADKAATYKHGGDRSKGPIGTSLSGAAQLLNVSERSAKRARKVSQDGAPGLPEMVERGDVPVSVAAEVAKLPQEAQLEAVAAGPDAVRQAARPHVTHNSGNNEWYTPANYIVAVRMVLGDIDLDPASCETANKTVVAKKYYTAEDDGLSKPWGGKVFLNPPYSSDLVGRFIEKLASEMGSVSEAIVLTNNATDTGWFQSLAGISSALCFPRGRVKFWRPDTDKAAPLQGQCFAYCGDNADRFVSVFSGIGVTCEVSHGAK